MRKIREILRLSEAGFSQRQIARSVKASPSTVSMLLGQARKAGLIGSACEDMDEEQLRELLYPQHSEKGSRPVPDWDEVHRELKRKDVTLQLLWEEYIAKNPRGYRYSYFCELYYGWRQKLEPPMRFLHRAGHKTFVDFAGQTVPVVNPETGQIWQAYVFVAALGASNYTYARAVEAENLENWIRCHCLAFTFFAGVTEVLVPDNPRVAVTHPSNYEPDLNPTYQEMAEYYGCAVIPARPRKPRDKSKVENAVQFVEQQILARLRKMTFFGLVEVNRALAVELEALNLRPFQKMPGNRKSLYEELDRPALRPLPPRPYEFARWKKLLVNRDYHVEVEGSNYSVPVSLIGEKVEVRLGHSTVEFLHQGRRVASHTRVQPGQSSTQKEHMPASHRAYQEWTPESLWAWAEKAGPNTQTLVQVLFEQEVHPDVALRQGLGLARLARAYGPGRLEDACERAVSLGAVSYKSVKSILETGLDRQAEDERPERTLPDHENIRGASYYSDPGVGLC